MKNEYRYLLQFDLILIPLETCETDLKPHRNRINLHELYSFAFLIKCSLDDSVTNFVSHRRKNVAEEFVIQLETDLRNFNFKYLKVHCSIEHNMTTRKI